MARRGRLTLLAVGGLVVAALAAGAAAYASAAGGPFTGTIAVGAGPAAIVIDDYSGRTFVGNAKDDSITMLDTQRGTVLRTLDAGGAPQTLAVAPHSDRLFAFVWSLSSGENVSVFDGHSGARLRTVTIGTQTTDNQGGAIAVDEQRGRVVVTDSADSRVAVLDARSGLLRRVFTAGLDPTALALDPRSGLAYVADGSRSKILVLDPARGRVLRALSVPHYPYGVALNAATGRLYVDGFDEYSGAGSASAIDLRSGRRLVSVTGAGEEGLAMVTDPRSGTNYEIDESVRSVSVLDRSTRLARTIARWGTFEIPAAQGTTLDAPRGRLLILDNACSATSSPPVPGPAQTGCVRVVDLTGRPSSYTVPVGKAPSALAVDPRTGRIFVANSQGGSGSRGGAGWIPSWLHDHLPWLTPPTTTGASASGTVSVISGT